jgi:XTP/dITP diphosphohydrolase
MGDPGIFSSRFAGEDANDEKNRARLLEEMEDADPDKRKARFVCVVVYYDGTEKRVFNGECKGSIINQKRGTGGFGYDPLFVPDGYTQTFAELNPEIKNEISHRGKALAQLREYLQNKVN